MRLTRSWLWLLLVPPLALGLARLRLDTEILNLLPDKLQVAQGLKLYQQHFANARELIITLAAPTAEETEAAARLLAQRLSAQTNLVAEVTWQPAWGEDRAQAAEMLAFLWLNQPPAVFGELTNRLAVTNLERWLQETRERLATSLSPNDLALGGYDPFGLAQPAVSMTSAAPALGAGESLFASGDGTFRVLFVEAAPDLSGYKACRSWLAEIQGLIAGWRNARMIPPQVEVHYTGRPAFVSEISGSMENDMSGSSAGTLAVIGLLFWLTHRRVRPAFWLLGLLLVILVGVLALGGLCFGTINVVSLGFASILAGLAEDFGIVIYQESRSHPNLSLGELRREVAPGIWWSAVTTMGAFLILNLSALPGLGQLGSLVALGIGLAAVVMLYGYAPLVLRSRRPDDLQPPQAPAKERLLLFQPIKLLPAPAIWLITALLLCGTSGWLALKGVHLDRSTNPLKPRHGEAYATLERVKARLGGGRDPLWVLVPGKDEAEVAQRLAQASRFLDQAAAHQLIAQFTLPTALWPQPQHQLANRPVAQQLLARRPALRAAALNAGFSTNALAVTDTIFDSWQGALAQKTVLWPTNRASRWILGKVMARSAGGFIALGLIQTTSNPAATSEFAAHWPSDLSAQGIRLSGWELLGSTVFELVLRELPRVLIPIVLLVLLTLWLAFRNFKEVVLSMATLGLSGLCLGAAMNLLHWDWNVLNLAALPLLLGMGVDFSIHVQLALRRYQGDLVATRQSIGRALLLAGATTVAGFASLGFSTNAGLASLGLVCALGITLALLIAVYLLPVWWKAWHQPGREGECPHEP